MCAGQPFESEFNEILHDLLGSFLARWNDGSLVNEWMGLFWKLKLLKIAICRFKNVLEQQNNSM